MAAGAGYTVGAPATATVTIADDDSPTADTAYVTGVVLGTLRNDYSGWVGMQFTVGASPLTVSELGRMMAPGNNGIHAMKLVKAGDGADVPGSVVVVAMSGGTAGQFRYVNLSSPVTLAAGTAYMLLSQEVQNGDTWYDLSTVVTTPGVASVNSGAYGSGPGAWFVWGGANQSYVPVSFKYGGAVPPPTRIIALSGSLAFGNVTVGATAQSALTISNSGNAALTITSISYPSGFSGNWSSGTIAAGGSQNVTVTFAPVAAQGYGGTVTVNSDATAGTNTIAASGTGTGGQGATAYVTGATLGNLRNDYSGWVGMQFTVGASPLTVSELGRMMAPGNNGIHAMKLVKAGDGADVPGSVVVVAMSGGTAGQFRYVNLSSPVTLAAGTAYMLLSQETAGGDSWYDRNTTLTTTGVAAANAAVWGTGPGDWNTFPAANQSYVPVDFKY